MFVQSFIKLSAAVMSSGVNKEKQLSDDAENNTAVASVGSNR